MIEDQRVLRPKLLKTIGLFSVSILLMASGTFLFEKSPIMAWVIVLFFGLCVLVALIQMLPNSSFLKLTEEGFEVRNFFKSNVTKWSEVDSFRVGNVGGQKMVMYDFSEEHQKYNVGKKIAKSLSGSEGALPDTYGMKANELATLMNDWKSKRKAQ